MTNTATLRGVTVGEGTVYPFMSPPRLPGITARQGTVPLIRGGSAFTGGDVGEAGTLGLEVFVNGATSAAVMPLLDTLSAAWSPSGVNVVEEATLVLGDQTRVYRGRPTAAVPDLTWLIEGHLSAARLAFLVSDYRWYSATVKSVMTAVGASTGGMVTPMVTPMVTTGSGSSGRAAVTNGGTAPADWVAVVTGGTAGTETPRLILEGQMVEIGGTVPAGSVLLVDSRDQYVSLDGAPRPWATPGSVWWKIPPGQSTFQFGAVSGDGTATLSWRDASF